MKYLYSEQYNKLLLVDDLIIYTSNNDTNNGMTFNCLDHKNCYNHHLTNYCKGAYLGYVVYKGRRDKYKEFHCSYSFIEISELDVLKYI